MTPNQRAAQLEDRRIDFAVSIMKVSKSLPNTYVGQHFAKQIIRSGSAPALLYGEARGSESTKDFRHKLSVALKELRETFINLKIIERAEIADAGKVSTLLTENNELISIFVSTVKSLDTKLNNKRSGT